MCFRMSHKPTWKANQLLQEIKDDTRLLSAKGNGSTKPKTEILRIEARVSKSEFVLRGTTSLVLLFS